MAEIQAEQGVKNEEQVAQVPSAEAPATPPTGEQPEAASPASEQPEGKVPYPRFKEVVEERNGVKKELEELRRKLEMLEAPKPEARPNISEKYAKKLVEKGVDEEAAKLIVSVSEEMAREVASESIRPLAEGMQKRDTDQWLADFQSKTPDYSEYEPKMYEIFKALPDAMKDAMVMNPKGIEFLYAQAKLASVGKVKEEAKAQGASEAYKNKAAKVAVTSGGAGSAVPPKKPLTRADVLALAKNPEAYEARRAEIMELVRQGKL